MQGVSLGGVAFDDDRLYLVFDGIIQRCTVSPFEVETAFRIPGYYVLGSATDGTDFFVTAERMSEFDRPFTPFKGTL